MGKKIVIAIASIAVIAVVISALLILEIQNQNPKIFCYAEENDTSEWYKAGHSPVMATGYFPNDIEVLPANFSSLQKVTLGVQIFNNGTKSLFNIAIDVSYRTTVNKWNTTARADLGFLDISHSKQTGITLTNPYLALWHTEVYIRHGSPTGAYYTFENDTVYFLNASDYKITAWGYAKP